MVTRGKENYSNCNTTWASHWRVLSPLTQMESSPRNNLQSVFMDIHLIRHTHSLIVEYKLELVEKLVGEPHCTCLVDMTNIDSKFVER